MKTLLFLAVHFIGLISYHKLYLMWLQFLITANLFCGIQKVIYANMLCTTCLRFWILLVD